MVSTLEAAPDSIPRIEPDQRLVLHGISWAAYEMIGTALSNRAHVRLTYDRGRLDIMTLSPLHERLKYAFGRLIDILSEELNVEMVAFGSSTYKLEEADRGLEPDQCYYFSNIERVLPIRQLDLTRDPVPDLAIEIDVTHSSVQRLGVYAGLGIPEVWRLEAGIVRVHLLGENRQYTEHATSSLMVPNFEVNLLVPFLETAARDSHSAMSRAFRAWLRKYIEDRGLTA